MLQMTNEPVYYLNANDLANLRRTALPGTSFGRGAAWGAAWAPAPQVNPMQTLLALRNLVQAFAQLGQGWQQFGQSPRPAAPAPRAAAPTTPQPRGEALTGTTSLGPGGAVRTHSGAVLSMPHEAQVELRINGAKYTFGETHVRQPDGTIVDLGGTTKNLYTLEDGTRVFIDGFGGNSGRLTTTVIPPGAPLPQLPAQHGEAQQLGGRFFVTKNVV